MTAPADAGLAHDDRCPLARPWLYDPDEGPLECRCPDLAADDALDDMIDGPAEDPPTLRLPHATDLAAVGACPACTAGEHVVEDGRCVCCDTPVGGS